jgi:hypothetical protein
MSRNRSVWCAVVSAIVIGAPGCGTHITRSPAYENGYSHGADAFQAEPLVKNGALARASKLVRACRTVANFYLVPYADRPEWIPGCVAGAKDFNR